MLRELLPARGTVLEVASGSGQHVAHFAAALPDLTWQPSDVEDAALHSIEQRTAGISNVLAPLVLDVCGSWPRLQAHAVVVANLFHISAAETVRGFFQGAAQVLQPGGLVHVYGPFMREGRHTSEGNRAFDENLRQRNPAWGIRALEDILSAAADAGLRDAGILNMPANNLSLHWRL